MKRALHLDGEPMGNARAWVVRWLAVLSVVACVQCTRGKSHPEGTQPASTAAQPAAAAAPVASAATGATYDDWSAGKLPASVLQGQPVSGGELVVGLRTDPPSLNTNVDSDLVARWITGHRIYQGLIDVDPFDDPNYRVVPQLAETWEISDDKKTYTFHLRKDVKWHDGLPFTARDVIATFDKVQDPTTKAVHVRSTLQELAGYSAPDDYTVVFKWKRPYFLSLDSLADIPIQPAHVIARLRGGQYNEAATNPLNRHPIGTGPFKFVAWESNQKIVLARNDQYWAQKPYLERLVFRIQTDHTVMLQLAERGEIDMVDQVTSEQWVHMDSATLRKHWNRSKFYSANYAWIGWNEERPFFSDKRVRRALTLLVDRPGIIEKMLYGLPRATTCHFYWASPSCDASLKPLPYDPAAAQKLLDEAGWKDSNGDGVRDKGGVEFRFIFMLPVGSTEAAHWAAKLKEDLARVGIEMELQTVEWAAFSKRLTEHRFDACTLLWGGGPRDEPSQIWHSSGIKGGSNFISYRNAAIDKMLEDARIMFDEEARNALYRRFGAILQDEQPYTFLYVRPELSLLSKKIKGARESLMWWQFESLWIDPSWNAAK